MPYRLPYERLVEACSVARDCNLRGRELRSYLSALVRECAPAPRYTRARPPSPGAVQRASLKRLRASLKRLRASLDD